MAQAAGKYVAYLRVSTGRQGRSGLGLEAQRETVKQFVAQRGGVIIAPEYVEVESGKRDDRPELDKALARCRRTGATLVVAKLDRLSRSAAFLHKLRDTGAPFIAADLPEANTLTIGVMASLAQHEREIISRRTKEALSAAKARGRRLGGLRAGAADIAAQAGAAAKARVAKANESAELLRSPLEVMQKEGLSLNAMAARLNAEGDLTPRGKAGGWTATAVRRVLARLDA
ncbi:recombinase family protein [Dongia deserti]|uniref:recombinase family protein n=1 Tax=Dongia deserti TaxID=2268030 RepID=UPI0025496B73|nr:recombinase family protein [Dongia deserti]